MPDPITRREFAGLVATGTLVSASGNVTCAEEKAAAAKVPPVSPVELLVDLVREKYPDERLNEVAIEEVRSDFRHFVGRSKVLSSFPLLNADEPGFIFSAWRADQATGGIK